MTENEAITLLQESKQKVEKYCCKQTVTTTDGDKDILRFECLEYNEEEEMSEYGRNEAKTINKFMKKYPQYSISKDEITVIDDSAGEHTFLAYVVT